MLKKRLAAARRGADLLERKQQILLVELATLRDVHERTAKEWARAAQNASAWLARATELDGPLAVTQAASAEFAKVIVQIAQVAGVDYPNSCVCTVPGARPLGGTAALAYAAAAHRTALEAAADYAAVDRAVLAVSAELAKTRTFRRAIEDRWVPRLEQEMARLLLELDEAEREENLRLRWAASRRSARRPGL